MVIYMNRTGNRRVGTRRVWLGILDDSRTFVVGFIEGRALK